MDLNRMINMVLNLVMRRLVNGGINKGIGLATRWRSTSGQADASPEEKRAEAQSAKETGKRLRQTSRLVRKLWR